MSLQAVVSYGEQFALYALSKEEEGVYNAELVRFYGNPAAAPPKEILLVKGVRKWIGHPANQELLNELGQVIEAHTSDRDKASQRLKGEPTNPENY